MIRRDFAGYLQDRATRFDCRPSWGLADHLTSPDEQNLPGERGLPLIRRGQTLPGLDGLCLVGMTVELSGLLNEIDRAADAVARALTR